MLIYQVIDLTKARSENLKLWTVLKKVVNDWSVTQWMMIFKGRLLKINNIMRQATVSLRETEVHRGREGEREVVRGPWRKGKEDGGEGNLER